MKRVLVVAYYFPPIGGIGSIRLARLAHFLPEFGWEPVILAPHDTPHSIDPHLSFDEAKVVRARSIELSRIGRAHRAQTEPVIPGSGSVQPGSSGGTARSTMRRVAKRLVFPDPQIGWWPGAVAAGRRHLKRESVDVVFSSSFPITAHLVACALSRRAGLPWIAEFRDPWSDRLPRIPYRRFARAVERGIACAADQVAMPTPTWAAHFGALWGTDVAVLPNGHELTSSAAPSADPPVLAHVGSYYPEHHCDLSMLWKALRKLRDAHGLGARVQWVGALPRDVSAQFSAAGAGEIELVGPVSHQRATQLTRDATMLFASGPRNSDSIARGWVPAKLFEYIASGRSVLYIGDPAGDAAALLRGQPGCFVCHPNDLDSILDALRQGLASLVHHRDAERFSRRSRARELAGLLDQLCSVQASERVRPPTPRV